MANENLKAALRHAGLTPEQFADIVGVDPKTVQRWIAGRTPYTRHRAIARALDSTEHALWPHRAPPRPASEPLGDGALTAGEVIGCWAYDTDHDAPDPATFISQTSGPIAIYDDGWYSVLQAPGLTDALLDAARGGREIRLLTHRPSRDLRPLIEQDRISIRLSWRETWVMVIHIEDTMLLALRLSLEADQPPPLLQLRRETSGGLFDRLAEHLELLWEHSDEIVTNLEHFYANVLEHDLDDDQHDQYDEQDDEEQDEQDEPEGIPEPPGPSATQSSAHGPPEGPTPPGSTESASDPRRRWPHRHT